MKFVVLGGCGTAGTDIIKDLIWEGSAPGMTNVVAKYCVGQLDKVEKVNVYATKNTSTRKARYLSHLITY
ncbi:MAG: hypothetical protein KAW83_00665 [Dehalococcoidia bacterium]|nr:hypothetical protein [Dehalococcoidia bacterium]